jgi:hypothetical protein
MRRTKESRPQAWLPLRDCRQSSTLLRARPERPRRRTAKKRDELPALHVRLQVQEVTLYWLKSTLIGLKSASKDYRGAQTMSAKCQ